MHQLWRFWSTGVPYDQIVTTPDKPLLQATVAAIHKSMPGVSSSASGKDVR